MQQFRAWADRISEYLIYFILAALPLERIPAFHPHIASFEVTVRLTQIAGLLLILSSLPKLWESRHQLLRSPWRWLVFLVFFALLSTGLAANLNRAAMVTAFIGFDIALAWAISNQLFAKRIQKYQLIIIISGVAASLFGIFQFFGDLRGLPTSITGLLPRYTQAVFSFPRVQAASYEPLFFANYLLIPISLAITKILGGNKRYLLAVAIMMTAFWLTLSRGAYFGLAGGMAILAIWAIRHKLFARIAATVGVMLLGIGLATLAVAASQDIKGWGVEGEQKDVDSVKVFADQSTGFTKGDSFYNRSVTWELAWDIFKTKPILGNGPGTFGIAAQKNNPAYFTDKNAVVNNEPLELLAEHGLLGTLSLFAFIGSLAIIAWRKLREGATALTHFQIGLIAALVGIAIQYQTFSTLYITHIWVAIGLLAGSLVLPAKLVAKE